MDKALHDLEWDRVADALLARSVVPRAAERPVSFATSLDGLRVALGETAEAIRLLSDGEPLPVEGARDVRPHLTRLSKEGALEGPALRDLRMTLDAASTLRKFLGRRKETAPRLHAACPIDPTLDRLSEEIAYAIDPDGTIADSASPDLRRLRTEVATLRGRLVSRLEEMIHKESALLSDRFFTVRDGRYVLPVRADAHERVVGIVHGSSSSGATIFVEPRALIEPGNRLKMAEGEMQREEVRILGLVSDLCRERLAEVDAAVSALEHADLKSASARLARDLGAVVPLVVDAPRIALTRARHPLLVLDGVEVVANDIALEAQRGLVLSGPNAGGKTVALKVLGLFSLMARAGLALPADEGSEIGFFDPVLTDVGDEQSIAKNLSTFSAHVTNISAILRQTRRGALVLLDELAGGTDPSEGAALACAILEALLERGAAVAVTTHYEALKAMALADPRLANASVGFDAERLAPTFELVPDVPGASSALAVASRFGIPGEVIARATAVLPAQSKTFDALSRDLLTSRRALDTERDALALERSRVEVKTAELATLLSAARDRDGAKLRDATDTLITEIRRARQDVRQARRKLERDALAESDVVAARQAAEEAEKLAARAAEAAGELGSSSSEPGTAPAADTLVVGARVFVPRLRTNAEVVEAPRKGKVKVAAGAMRLTVDVAELRTVAPAEARGASVERAPSATSPPADSQRRELWTRTTDNTLDVRGLRVDEALSMAESFLDRLYGAAEPAAFIVHGLGSGALRDALRKELGGDSRYVRDVRAGTHDEGGDGVTVFSLR